MSSTKIAANISSFERIAKFLMEKMTKCRCKTYFRILKNQ